MPENSQPRESPETLLRGGPLDGKRVRVVFNPTHRFPFYPGGVEAWDNVRFAQYILSEDKRGVRVAKYIGEIR